MRSLSPRLCGPYHVTQKIEEVSYKLQLPTTSNDYPILHVSFLKNFVLGYSPQPLPQVLSEDSGIIATTSSFIESLVHAQGEAEVLAQWQDLSSCVNSWELLTAPQQQFPTFHLEDKVRALGGALIAYH